MRRAENNTSLATRQQELDKFNEDRQGNKEKKDEKSEERHRNSQMASPTNVSKTKGLHTLDVV